MKIANTVTLPPLTALDYWPHIWAAPLSLQVKSTFGFFLYVDLKSQNTILYIQLRSYETAA